MAGVVNKLLNFFQGNEEVEEEETNEGYSYENEYADEGEETENKGFFKRGKVVNIAQTEQVKMNVIQVTSFEQSENICNMLKQKQSIIVNLEYVNKDIARRVIDFVSGSAQALNGHIQKVSNSIFVVVPFNYELSNEMAREELRNKISVSWLKNNN